MSTHFLHTAKDEKSCQVQLHSFSNARLIRYSYSLLASRTIVLDVDICLIPNVKNTVVDGSLIEESAYRWHCVGFLLWILTFIDMSTTEGRGKPSSLRA